MSPNNILDVLVATATSILFIAVLWWYFQLRLLRKGIEKLARELHDLATRLGAKHDH